MSEPLGIVGKLGGVLEGQPRGASVVTCRLERRYLDELTLAPWRRAGWGRRELRHVRRMWRAADAGLTSR